jgi:hypothetical protein
LGGRHGGDAVGAREFDDHLGRGGTGSSGRRSASWAAADNAAWCGPLLASAKRWRADVPTADDSIAIVAVYFAAAEFAEQSATGFARSLFVATGSDNAYSIRSAGK